MADDEGFSSDSDDVDYVPSGGEDISEEENSGDEEDASLLKDTGNEGIVNQRKTQAKKSGSFASRKRCGGIQLEGEEASENGKDEDDAANKQLAENIVKETERKKEEKEKKKADDLWASFLSDVKQPSKRPAAPSSGLASLTTVAKPASASGLPTSGSAESGTTVNVVPDKPSQNVTVTQVFDFAGEEVKITKQVAADSKEAKAVLKEQESAEMKSSTASSLPSKSPGLSLGGAPSVLAGLGLKRPAAGGSGGSGGGGLSSILNKINKKPKISTLEKSKLDWDSFKKTEGIEEDLKIHNRGKSGYIERQAFLERTDLRQFEIEKNVRLGSSGKR